MQAKEKRLKAAFCYAMERLFLAFLLAIVGNRFRGFLSIGGLIDLVRNHYEFVVLHAVVVGPLLRREIALCRDEIALCEQVE